MYVGPLLFVRKQKSLLIFSRFFFFFYFFYFCTLYHSIPFQMLELPCDLTAFVTEHCKVKPVSSVHLISCHS